ncbi:urease accessory protein UreJ [Candidatus Woesearchaeota archaeon]|nr:MAG: urease accessory protein UreJ [Candidatus Woesearchaeota archaeon]
MKKLPSLFPAALLAIPAVHAHLIGGAGLSSGLTHPFGLDHLLAMVAVGVMSVQLDEQWWRLPAVFVGAMLLGGVAAILGLSVPFVETGVAVSVLFFGIAIALSVRLKPVWMMLSVGVFAFLHGHAHGTELPLIASPALYALGFTITTAFLHVAGVCTALVARRYNAVRVLNYAGAAMAFTGLLFIFGMA